MRALALAAVTIATLGAASRARADGYYATEGVGVVRAQGGLAAHLPGTDLRARLALGVRYHAFAVEGWFAQAQDIHASLTMSPDPDDPSAQLAMFGVDLRASEPIAPHLEGYVRATASRLYISHGDLDGLAQRGLGAGTGLALRGKVRALGFLWAPLFFTHKGPLVGASAFVDTGVDVYRAGRLTNAMLGFAVGSDF